MADSVLDGFGCYLKIAGTKFAGSVVITLPKRTRGKMDITKLDQRDGGGALDPEMKFAPLSLFDNGDLQVEAFYTPTDYKTISDLLKTPGKQAYIFTDNQPASGTGPVAASATFNGFVTELGDVKREKDKPSTFSFTVCIADTFVFSAGTPGS